MNLPPLPEPQTLVVDSDVGSRAYTAWQMRAYATAAAEAAVLAERARVLAWLDTALADSGICWPGEADIVREQIARGE